MNINVTVIKDSEFTVDTGLGSNITERREDLTSIRKTLFDNFMLMIKEVCAEKLPMIKIPDYNSVYTMIKPCPVNGDLDVKIWAIDFVNNKVDQVITINILALHFDSDGNRVPLYDTKSHVIADMSEERSIRNGRS